MKRRKHHEFKTSQYKRWRRTGNEMMSFGDVVINEFIGWAHWNKTVSYK
jgi:hypothetical protein